ncbi:MAG TPA: VWA domain-containing protein [Candidatus Acidoferrales bacterium]|jgi:VWFA-related protein|nr:VWA domain-containing protein [Candidatus Acidoferrales bacterium]
MRSQTRVVQIDVVVKDSRGRPVSDLSKPDFTVIDRGKPRAIQIFSIDRGGQAPESGQPAERPQPTPAAAANVFSNRVPAIAAPGRVTAIVLDGNNTTFDDFAYARTQIIDLVGKLRPGDRMAIYVLYLGLAIVQDYTSDRELLMKSITAYRPPALTPRAGMSRRPTRPATGMLPSGDVSDELTTGMSPAETAFFVRRRAEDTMAAFRAISSHMSILPGRKSVIWVSGGFSGRQLIDSKASFDATTAAMNDANVALYAVDARLLMNGTQNNIDTMQRFAEATGGKAYYHRNDLGNAVGEAVEDSQVTYTLGFYLAGDERDGEFHPLRVSVNRRGLELRYRQGYYAGPESSGDPARKKQALEAELLNPRNATDLGIDARVDLVKGRSGSELRIRMNLDPRTLTLKRSGGEWSGKIDNLFVERAQDGTVLAKISNSVEFQFTEKTRARYEAGAMVVPASIRLVNSAVTLHIIVRDAGTGRTGSLIVPLQSILATAAK